MNYSGTRYDTMNELKGMQGLLGGADIHLNDELTLEQALALTGMHTLEVLREGFEGMLRLYGKPGMNGTWASDDVIWTAYGTALNRPNVYMLLKRIDIASGGYLFARNIEVEQFTPKGISTLVKSKAQPYYTVSFDLPDVGAHKQWHVRSDDLLIDLWAQANACLRENGCPERIWYYTAKSDCYFIIQSTESVELLRRLTELTFQQVPEPEPVPMPEPEPIMDDIPDEELDDEPPETPEEKERHAAGRKRRITGEPKSPRKGRRSRFDLDEVIEYARTGQRAMPGKPVLSVQQAIEKNLPGVSLARPGKAAKQPSMSAAPGIVENAKVKLPNADALDKSADSAQTAPQSAESRSRPGYASDRMSSAPMAAPGPEEEYSPATLFEDGTLLDLTRRYKLNIEESKVADEGVAEIPTIDEPAAVEAPAVADDSPSDDASEPDELDYDSEDVEPAARPPREQSNAADDFEYHSDLPPEQDYDVQYDASGNPIEYYEEPRLQYYDESGNPVEVEYYDEYGQPVNRQYYDADGNPVEFTLDDGEYMEDGDEEFERSMNEELGYEAEYPARRSASAQDKKFDFNAIRPYLLTGAARAEYREREYQQVRESLIQLARLGIRMNDGFVLRDVLRSEGIKPHQLIKRGWEGLLWFLSGVDLYKGKARAYSDDVMLYCYEDYNHERLLIELTHGIQRMTKNMLAFGRVSQKNDKQGRPAVLAFVQGGKKHRWRLRTDTGGAQLQDYFERMSELMEKAGCPGTLWYLEAQTQCYYMYLTRNNALRLRRLTGLPVQPVYPDR